MKRLPRAHFLFGGRKLIERFRQHLVSRAIADFVNDVLLHLRQRPGFADGRAAL